MPTPKLTPEEEQYFDDLQKEIKKIPDSQWFERTVAEEKRLDYLDLYLETKKASGTVDFSKLQGMPQKYVDDIVSRVFKGDSMKNVAIRHFKLIKTVEESLKKIGKTTLQTLSFFNDANVDGRGFDNATASFIFEALKLPQNRTLKNLDLSGNNVRLSHAATLIESLSRANNTTLTDLGLARLNDTHRYVSQQLSFNENNHRMEAPEKFFAAEPDPNGAQILLDAVKNSALVSINVDYNRLKPEEEAAILAAVRGRAEDSLESKDEGPKRNKPR